MGGGGHTWQVQHYTWWVISKHLSALGGLEGGLGLRLQVPIQLPQWCMLVSYYPGSSPSFLNSSKCGPHAWYCSGPQVREAPFSLRDIMILDKEECWQHWTCSYSLCVEIRALNCRGDVCYHAAPCDTILRQSHWFRRVWRTCIYKWHSYLFKTGSQKAENSSGTRQGPSAWGYQQRDEHPHYIDIT